MAARKPTSPLFFEQPHARASHRTCDAPGCPHPGEHRAPKDRNLKDYYWFCLDHVRIYNSGWNYYAGLAPEAIEREIRSDVTWNRPTWPFAARPTPSAGRARFYAGGARVHAQDGFGLFGEEGEEGEPRPDPRKTRASTPEEAQALSVLDLSHPITLEQLKVRYKDLVKRHHPDANGGDPAAEERIKRINQAYATLRAVLAPRADVP